MKKDRSLIIAFLTSQGKHANIRTRSSHRTLKDIFFLNYHEKAWTGANTISNIQNTKSYLTSLIQVCVSESKQHLKCNHFSNFIVRDRTNISVSLQLFEFDHFLAYKCIKLATLQISIYHSRKLVFDQFTNSCSVRRAVIFFQERACESTGWALFVTLNERQAPWKYTSIFMMSSWRKECKLFKRSPLCTRWWEGTNGSSWSRMSAFDDHL